MSIANLVGRCSSYRLVQLQMMPELRKDKLISCDGWPDSYQERNAFKPHCKDATTRGCRGKLSPGAKGCGCDSAITPEEE